MKKVQHKIIQFQLPVTSELTYVAVISLLINNYKQFFQVTGVQPNANGH